MIALLESGLGKAAWQTLLYISVAWILMTSYQMFTQTAVTTLVTYINMLWPQLGSWLIYRVDLIISVCAFAWVFVVSSAIPSIILGKERGVLLQFAVCLILTFLAFVVFDILESWSASIDPIRYFLGFALLLKNPFSAFAYLIAPYALMIAIDLHGRRKRKKEMERLEKFNRELFAECYC
jgi:hypothetical protein